MFCFLILPFSISNLVLSFHVRDWAWSYIKSQKLTWAFVWFPAPSDVFLQERLKEMQSDLQTIRESHETSVELIKTETSKLQDEMAKIQQHLEEQLREAQYR